MPKVHLYPPHGVKYGSTPVAPEIGFPVDEGDVESLIKDGWSHSPPVQPPTTIADVAAIALDEEEPQS